MSSASAPNAIFSQVPYWMDIVSGRRQGICAGVCRAGLTLLTPAYSAAMSLRNLAFDRGWRSQTRAPACVISIGNLTAGGTGKTPTVAWVVRTLQALGGRPSIISRGYGGHDGVNDEKLLLDQLLPGVPHLLNPDRVAAAKELLSRAAPDRPQSIVLDDAFQHRRIARDFDLVLIDCLNPWGYGHLFPRGLLREPLRSLKRASCVLLTRCDQVDDETRQRILHTTRQWTAAPILSSSFQPTRLLNSQGERRRLEDLQREHVAAFCGIGNPVGFRRTLTSCGIAIPDNRFRIFPDHHAYQPAELKSLGEWARSVKAECLLTTQKDLVKIPTDTLGEIPLWALGIELRFEDQESEIQLAEMLRSVVGSATSRSF